MSSWSETTRARPRPATHYRGVVGYNPFRKRVQRRSDIVLVGVTLLVVALLVLWALLPR